MPQGWQAHWPPNWWEGLLCTSGLYPRTSLWTQGELHSPGDLWSTCEGVHRNRISDQRGVTCQGHPEIQWHPRKSTQEPPRFCLQRTEQPGLNWAMTRRGWGTGGAGRGGRGAGRGRQAVSHTWSLSSAPLLQTQIPPGDSAEGPYMRLSTPAASPSCKTGLVNRAESSLEADRRPWIPREKNPRHACC